MEVYDGADERLLDEDNPSILGFPSVSINIKYPKWPQVLATLIACLGALSGGYVIGFSSPTIPQLKETTPPILLTDDQASWYSSIMTLGAAAGGPVAGLVAGKLGRKAAIMSTAVPTIAGWVLIAWSEHYQWFYVARFLTGVGLGMTCMVVPTYIAEVSSKDLRGMLGGGFQLILTTGVLLAFAVGMLLTWKWMAIVGAGISAFLVLLILFIPESPRWLLAHQQPEKAWLALEWLRRNPEQVDEEYKELTHHLLNQESTGVSLRDFGQPQLYRPLIISLGLMVFQQWSGINAVMFNSKSLLDASFPDHKGIAGWANDGLALVQVLFTLVACIFSDRCGRRVLLLLSSIIMGLSITALGVYFYFTEHLGYNEESLAPLSVSSLCLYIAGFSIGWGAIPWLLMAELFPNNARSTAGAICTAVNWSASFLVTKMFASIQSGLKDYGAFWIFAAIILAGFVFTACLLPETKGKTLDEIQHDFATPRRRNREYRHENTE